MKKKIIFWKKYLRYIKIYIQQLFVKKLSVCYFSTSELCSLIYVSENIFWKNIFATIRLHQRYIPLTLTIVWLLPAGFLCHFKASNRDSKVRNFSFVQVAQNEISILYQEWLTSTYRVIRPFIDSDFSSWHIFVC